MQTAENQLIRLGCFADVPRMYFFNVSLAMFCGLHLANAIHPWKVDISAKCPQYILGKCIDIQLIKPSADVLRD